MASFWDLKRIKRRREIVRIFMKHGLGYLFKKWGLGGPFSRRRTAVGIKAESGRMLAVNLRSALVELGPTFVKLGQVLSTRPDILPPVFIEELEKLQDKVEPISYALIREQIKRELGDPEEIFAEFLPDPLAAASIGQVHLARLKTGEKVIVKVQRPDIEEKVRSDLIIIQGLARMAERRSTDARRLGVAAMVEEYGKALLRELDYAREFRNTERVYKNFEKDQRVRIPMVYQEYTTPRVLTEEFIEGVKLSKVEEIERRGWDRGKISRLGTEAFLAQVFIHGFFQADPHPGNILVVDENTIAFIDFGEIGSLTENRLVSLGELLIGIYRHDLYQAISILQEMGIATESNHGNEDFYEDFADLIDNISSTNIGNLDMKRLRREVMELAYNYSLNMPAYLTSLMKALITVEGVGKKLDPDFNFTEVMKPLATQLYRERLQPGNVYKYMRSKYFRELRPLAGIPGHLNTVLRDTGQGKLGLNLHIEFTPRANRKITQLVNRLSLSLVITGTLIGSALIIQTNHSPGVERYAYLGVAGFAVALVSLAAFFFGSFRS